MNFLTYTFREREDTKIASIIFIISIVFYFIMNYQIVGVINSVTSSINPFYTDLFKVNLFNFDPVIYYDSNQSSVIHPFLGFISIIISTLAKKTFLNYSILMIYSLINSANVAMFYLYLRKNKIENFLAIAYASFYAVSSYMIITSFIPDSYTLAQFGIVFSFLYLQYLKQTSKENILQCGFIGLINFGITSSNVVPFFLSVFFNNFLNRTKQTLKKVTLIFLICISMIMIVSFFQWLFLSDCWIFNYGDKINKAGFVYTELFSFEKHSSVFRLMFISPLMTPEVRLIDKNLMAIVTDSSKPLPFHVFIVGIIFYGFCIVSIIKKYWSRELWKALSFISFYLVLHILIGYGLAVVLALA